MRLRWLALAPLCAMLRVHSQGFLAIRWFSTSGGCIAASGKGAFDEHWDWTIQDCKIQCEMADWCKGFEFVSFSKPRTTRCELHKEHLVRAAPETNTLCIVKDTAAARQSWRGMIDGGSSSLDAKMNMRRGGVSMYTHSSHRQACVEAAATAASSDISGLDLRGCQLLEAVMDKVKMDGTIFDRALMERASLLEVSGTYSTFFDTLMAASYLTKSNLAYSTFAGADMSGAEASFFLCTECVFTRTKMVGTQLNDGSFLGANFHAADLTNANCFKADFSGASLRDVLFKGATLTMATFVEADVAGADFEGAVITEEELIGAINVDKALNLNFKIG
eukprot:CAMPEP_0183355548 /NCGR_PEP_ID=MMETSP0164_2-20130417/40842_1 /TAXON_ID=221442 /ORGANISM="Coccolithus pelagicus ssp braarudi, Strain PLY182g" /LENGTH=333 /DNA_ID=CAMNT_0025528687 /DNA_START=9 /DNA_END=1010 /DNA_ORIENTATION=+